MLPNTPNLTSGLPLDAAGTQVACPTGYGYGTGTALNDGTCRSVSLPRLANNVFWQNRPFHVEVTNATDPLQAQQKIITVVPSLNQTYTGQVVTQGTYINAPGSGAAVSYWDLGVRGDTSPTPNSGSGFALAPSNSVLTSTSGYAGSNSTGNPAVLRQYSNGARIPPENCLGVDAIDQPRCKGYYAPVGRAEFTGLPVEFSLNQVVVAATVDEGNNWVSLNYGPLSLIDSVDPQHPVLGNYAIGTGSQAIGMTTSGEGSDYTVAPTTDFFGSPSLNRKSNNAVDAGAVEFVATTGGAASVTPSGVTFVNTPGTSSTQTLTLRNNGTVTLTGITVVVAKTAPPPLTPNPFTRLAGGCGTTLAAGATCAITLQFTAPATPGTSTGTATITASAPVSGSPVTLSGTSANTDMSITKADGLTTVFRNSPVSYQVVVRNNGPGTATRTFTDTLPGGALFNVTSHTCTVSGGGTCSTAGSGNTTRTGTVTGLTSGSTATFTLNGTVAAGAAAGAMINTVAFNTGDAIAANNTATDTDTIVIPTSPAGTIAFSSVAGGAATCSGSCTTLAFGNETGSVSSTVRLTVGGGAGAAVTFGQAVVTNGGGNTNFSWGADTCSGNSISNGGTCDNHDQLQRAEWQLQPDRHVDGAQQRDRESPDTGSDWQLIGPSTLAEARRRAGNPAGRLAAPDRDSAPAGALTRRSGAGKVMKWRLA